MHSLGIVAAGLLLAWAWAASASSVDPKGSGDVTNVSRSNTAFAVDLYHKLEASPGNVFFSPLSLSSALAMTYAGARGDTAQQMASVLHFPADRAAMDRAFAALMQDFNPKSGEYELAVANALWGQKGYAFLEPFLDTVKRNYGGRLSPLDFKKDSEQARQTINAWVAKQTRDKIQGLIGPGVLNGMTRLVLTNAVYFKGTWVEPFSKRATRDDLFHVSGDKTVTVPMMHIAEHFGYLEQDQFQALEMPYKGGTLSMIVLLPKAVDGLPALERSVTPDQLAGWLKDLAKQVVIVSVPRFKMTQECSLAKTLGEMGMPLAFSDAADFSGMDGRRDLFISAVLHKAYVDVNEEGTEAAAATAMPMAVTAAPVRVSPPVFRADHPFLFLIRDRRSDSILFMGRVVNPKA